ncbi:hypothetical protein HNQ99_000826 [Rhizorhapis suberifaciens]|uniref:Uncharacterized protein n=1 Tax=Rhizorhapis suberifaciens TaxID=13656 RepID=A0A840HSJ3_9SPHN|nr:hypothetical protein [Rhizorhapis suberifaciens]
MIADRDLGHAKLPCTGAKAAVLHNAGKYFQLAEGNAGHAGGDKAKPAG